MGKGCSCWFCVDIYLTMTQLLEVVRNIRMADVANIHVYFVLMFWFNVRKRVIWGKDEEIFVSQMSRYLFPLLFALFNIFYWSHYLNQVFTLSIVYFPQKWDICLKIETILVRKRTHCLVFDCGENCLFLTSYVFICPIPGTEGVWFTQPNRKEIISSLIVDLLKAR